MIALISRGRAAATASSLLITALLAAPAAQATNGYFANGYGVKSEATGGTGIALAQDTLTIAANPAGLADLGDGVDAGLALFHPQRGATLAGPGGSASFDGNDTANFFIPSLGYSHHLSPRLVLGIALFGNGGLDTDYAVSPFGAPGHAGVNLSQAFLSPAIAWKITDHQSLGLALNYVYQQFEARGVGLFAGFGLSSAPTALSDNGKDSSTGLGFRLGWNASLGERVHIGATWQPKTSTSRFSKYAGLFADQGKFDVPATYGVGLAWAATPQLQLALDWQRIQYSGVPSVGNPVNALFGGVLLGASNGPGFGWQDISVYRVGAVYRASDRLTLRAGYANGSQPVQASQTFFNILAPGVVKAHYTVGASVQLGAQDELSFSYVNAPKVTVNGSGSIPPAFGGGEANVHLAEQSVGLSYNHRF